MFYIFLIENYSLGIVLGWNKTNFIVSKLYNSWLKREKWKSPSATLMFRSSEQVAFPETARQRSHVTCQRSCSSQFGGIYDNGHKRCQGCWASVDYWIIHLERSMLLYYSILIRQWSLGRLVLLRKWTWAFWEFPSAYKAYCFWLTGFA